MLKGVWKTKRPRKLGTVDVWLRKSQRRPSTLPGTGGRAHSDYILIKTLVAFCPCPENLCVAELTNTRLISLTEEILRQNNIETVEWLLPIMLMQV